ncbi:MAG: hypothetical protein QM820_21120 [Minicystis sp.]
MQRTLAGIFLDRMAQGSKGAVDMKTLRSIASVLAVAALASLFGVNCASTEAPVNAGENTTVGATADSGDMALAEDEQTGESRGASQPSYGAPRFAPAPPPGTLTFSCAGFWDGVWCGGNQGFPGSNHALYYCHGGTGFLLFTCPGLCVAGPSGVEDHC